MKNSKFVIDRFAKLLEQGIVSSKDITSEILSILKSKRDELVFKLKLTGKDEFEILLKRVETLEKKIKVTNTPNVLNEAVAELTILLILAASRRIGEAYNLVRTDNWKNQKPDLTKFMIGNSVTGKTLGIIGMGRIGRMAAKSAKAFGMKIIYYNRNKLSADLEDGAKYYSDLNSMLPNCDFVSIHTPATAETKYILNKDTISLLPKHAVVINTSRGSTIDDDALIDALENKKIYAAGLDVFNNEPILDKRDLKLDYRFGEDYLSQYHQEQSHQSPLSLVVNDHPRLYHLHLYHLERLHSHHHHPFQRNLFRLIEQVYPHLLLNSHRIQGHQQRYYHRHQT